jgi:His Kinase A (phospho-acceptor) domain
VARQPIRMLATGAAYVLVYVCLTLFGPPLSRTQRPLVALPATALPALVSGLLALRAARASQGAERTFWTLFALASGAHVLSHGTFLAQALRLPRAAALMLPGHLALYAFFALSLVAFSARPDRPRSSRLADTAAIEWMMALSGFYFLIFFFGGVPAPGDRSGWQIVFTLQEALPAAAAMWLAAMTREAPFQRVYALLALGYGGALLWGAIGNWTGGRFANALYGPRDAVWMLPFVGMAAAACCARAPFVVGAAPAPGRGRGWLAASALVLPPLLDLSMRAAGVDAAHANERSLVTLTAVVVMSSLLALRLRTAPRDTLAAAELPGGPGARAARTAHLAFASGVAHELNNPLMAVAGWAEVVHDRGEGGPAVLRLLEASRAASDAVAQLQKVVQAGVADPAPRAVPE